MADITQERLKQAIIKAENAGNTEDVKILVDEYVARYGTGEPRETPNQPALGEPRDSSEERPTSFLGAVKQSFIQKAPRELEAMKRDFEGIRRGVIPSNQSRFGGKAEPFTNPPSIEDFDEAAKKELKDLPEYRGGFGGMVRALLYPDVKERAMLFADEGFDVNTDGPYPTITNKLTGDEFAINSPGWSLQDAISLVGEIATFLPAGKFTSVGASLAKKIARGIAAGATTSGIREGVQVAGGGEFNGMQVAFDTIATAGGGALEQLAPAIWRKLSPAARKKARDVKSINSLIELGVDIDELKAVVSKEIIEPSAALEEFSAAQFKKALEKDSRLAAKYAKEYEEASNNLSAMLSRTFGRLSKQDIDLLNPEETLLNVFSASQDLASNIQKVQFQMPMALIGREYPEVYKRLGDINVAGAVNLADEIIKNSNTGDKAQKAAMRWKRLLESPKEGDVVLFDSAGRQIGLEDRVEITKPAEQVHLAIRELGDILKIDPNFNSSVGGQVKSNAKKLIQELKTVLGDDFRKVDGAYSRSAKALDNFKKNTKLAESLSEGGLDADKFLDAIFKAEPGTANFAKAKEFMDEVANFSPSAANDLYGSYFAAKIRSLPTDANMNQILDAIYGTGRTGDILKSSVYRLAPNKAAQKRVQQIGFLLKSGSKVDPVESLAKAGQDYVDSKLSPDAAHFVYIRMAISKAIKDSSNKKFLETAYNMTLNPKYRKEYLDLLNSKKVLQAASKSNFLERQDAANTVYRKALNIAEKVASDMKNGSLIGAAIPGILTSQSREDGVQQVPFRSN